MQGCGGAAPRLQLQTQACWAERGWGDGGDVGGVGVHGGGVGGRW